MTAQTHLRGVLRYLAACAVAGVIAGRGFGAFARARFHYPLRLDDASYWHRTALNALEVVEWPSLFGLTLACALALWRWLPFASLVPGLSRGELAQDRPVGALVCGVCIAVAMLIAVPATNQPGRLLSAFLAGLLGLVAAALLLTFWRQALTENRSVLARWLSQLPLAAGHLAVMATAALSLGFRGESALVHGIALLVGIAIFVVELLVALVIAALANRR